MTVVAGIFRFLWGTPHNFVVGSATGASIAAGYKAIQKRQDQPGTTQRNPRSQNLSMQEFYNPMTSLKTCAPIMT